MHKIVNTVKAITGGIIVGLVIVTALVIVIVGLFEAAIKRFGLMALAALLLSSGAFAQLVSQGNETTVIYSGSNAPLFTSLPATNLTQITGTNTFILSVSAPASAVRLYITNDTVNSCNNSFQITVAATGEQQVNSFNSSIGSWQIVPIINPVTGVFSTNTGLINLVGSSTAVITTAAAASSKIAIIINNTLGTCATTTLDAVAVITPVAITSPLVTVASNGAITGAGNATQVQGVVPQGASSTNINPLLIGGAGPAINGGITAVGFDNSSVLGVNVPTSFKGNIVEDFVPPLQSSGFEFAVVFNLGQGGGTNSRTVQAPFRDCNGGGGCDGAPPAFGSFNSSNVPGVATLNGAVSAQPFVLSYGGAGATAHNDVTGIMAFTVPAGSSASVRQGFSNAGSASGSFSSNTAVGSTIAAAEICTTVCTGTGLTDSQGIVYRQVNLIAPGGISYGSLSLWIGSTTTTAAADTLTFTNGSGSIAGIAFVELTGLTPSQLVFPSTFQQMDATGAQVDRLDATSANQFNCTVTLSTNTTTQCQGAPSTFNGAVVRLVVTDFQINTTTAGTATTIQLKTGTGTNCGTGTANLSAIQYPNAATGITTVTGFRIPLIAPFQSAVCVTQAGTTAGTSVIEVHGFIEP